MKQVGLLVSKFTAALEEASVAHTVKTYDGVGHAFWKSVSQVEQREEPVLSAYRQTTSFLKEYFAT